MTHHSVWTPEQRRPWAPLTKVVATSGQTLNAAPGFIIQDDAQRRQLTADVGLDWKTWLPFCSKVLKISPDPADYVLFPAMVMISDLPNRNCVGFPLRELVKWHRDAGKQAYKLWQGQPVFVEHDNEDHTKASGVIIDVSLRAVPNVASPNTASPLHKLLFLMAVDRVKNPELAQRILNKTVNMVSMGAYCDDYSCSKCGALLGKCGHLNAKRKFDFYVDRTGELVYRMVESITPFECSVVGTGAFPMSTFQQVFDLNLGQRLWNDGR